jgi:NhaA family Na+:H+ antiporter
VVGIVLWFAVLRSGIHPTIAGVTLGLLTAVSVPSAAATDAPEPEREAEATASAASAASAAPVADDPGPRSANERFQAVLHPWTSYAIVPLFALANAGVDLGGGVLRDAIGSPVTLGVVLALVVGKLAGITVASLAAVRSGVGTLPTGVTVRHLVGAAALAGIGFTVSLFVAELSFDDPLLTDEAKVGVLVASVLAGGLGTALLVRAPTRPPAEPER